MGEEPRDIRLERELVEEQMPDYQVEYNEEDD